MHAGSSTEIKRQMVKQFTKERESWKKRGELCLLLTGRILAGGVVCLIQRCGLVNSGVCFVWSDLQELRAAKSVANRRDISSTNTNSQELFSIGSDASYNSGTAYWLQTILKKVVHADLLIANKGDMDLSGSARTPRSPCVSAIFECHTISRVHPSETVQAPLARTYHRELERAWQFDTTWDSPFQQNYETVSHTFWRASEDCS